MVADLKVAFRGLVRAPLFGLSAVSTLALGLGVTVTTYAVLDSVVLEDLPYPDAERLVDVYSTVPGLGFDRWEVTEAGYLHFAGNSRALERVGAYRTGSLTVEGEEGALRASAAQVTPGLLEVLGARAHRGRLLVEADAERGAAPVVLVSHAYWVDRLGSDPEVIGRSLTALGRSREIVGVLPPRFDLPEEEARVWLPLPVDRESPDADSHSLRVIARLGPDVPVGLAQEDLQRLTSELPRLFPSEYSEAWMRDAGFATVVQPLDHRVVDSGVRGALWILTGASALVLLIAAGNVTNLFLARRLDRRREIALRRAVGAAGRDVFRLFWAEALLVGAGAASVGLAVAVTGVEALSSARPPGLPRAAELSVDASTLGLAVLVVFALTVALGAIPLAGARRTGSPVSLDGGGGVHWSTGDPAQQTLRGVLVVGQLALTVALLGGSGLLIRSFQQLSRVDPGFTASGVLAMDVHLPASSYPDQRSVSALYHGLRERIRALPGVEEAGAASALPLEAGLGCYALYVEAEPLAADEQPPCVDVHVATPGYFRALGIRMEEGRAFESRDNDARTGALVVTGALARRLWAGGGAVGEGASIHGYREPWFRVVGVTGEILADGLDRPPSAAVFFPMVSPEGARRFLGHRAKMTLVVRTGREAPLTLVPALRRTVSDLDPSVATASPRLMTDVLKSARGETTLAAGLLLTAALAALALGALGLYAVVAHTVRGRTREIGIRISLGADGTRIMGLVLRRSGALVAGGAVLGLLVYWGGARLLGSLVFGVSPADPVILGGVGLVLGLAAGLAILVPARAAAAVEPVAALRES